MDQQHKDDLARILANRRMGKRMLKPEQGSAPQSAGIGGAPPHNAPPPAAGSIHARTPGPTMPSPQSYAPAAAAAPQLPLQQQASAAAASAGGDAGGYAPQQQHQAPAPKPQSLGSVVNSNGGVAAVEHTHQADLQVAAPPSGPPAPAPSALSNPNSGAGAQPTPKMSLSSAVMMSSSPASSAAPTNAPRRPSDLGQQSITPMTSSNAPGLPAQPHQHQQQNADVGGVQIQSGNAPGQPVSPASQGTDGVSPGLEVRTPPQRPAAGDSTDMNLLQDDVVPLSISAPVPASALAPAAPTPAAAAANSSQPTQKSAAPLPPSEYAVGAAPATPAVRTSADGQSTRNADGSFAGQQATPSAGSRLLPDSTNASGAAAAPPPGYTAKQLESMLPPVQVQGTTGSTFQPLLSSTTPRLSYSQPRAGSLGGGGYRAPSPYAGGGLGSTNLGGGTTFSTAGAASPYPVSAAGGGGQVTAADVMRGFEQIDSQAKRDASLPRGTATGGVRSSSVTNTNVFAGIGGVSGGYSGGYSGVGGGYSASSAAPPLSIQASTAAYQSTAASGTGSYAQYRGGGGGVGGITSTAFSGPTGTTPITRTTRSSYTSPSRNGGGVLGGGLGGGGGFTASTSSFAPRNYENFGATQPVSAAPASSSAFAASASSPPGSAFNRGRSGYQSQLPQDSAPSVIAGAGGAGGAPGVVRSGSAGRRGSVSFGAAAQAVRLGVAGAAGVRSPQPPVHRQRSRSGGRESPKMVEFPAPYEPTESGDGGPEVIFPRDLTGVSSGVLTGATRTVGAATSGTGAGDVRTSMALLAKGDWWHKWDRNGRTVKPVYAFVDKNTLMWGRTPKTANALFSNFVQLEKIADVSSREIFDHTDHGARVFYVLEVHTMGRVLKIGTEKRAKLDSWYAALSDVVDFYRAQGIQGLSSNPAD